jgi:molybdopterin converting factor small subunit
MARFDILMFAAARELSGTDVLVLEMESPASASSILNQIGKSVPSIAPMLPACRLAVDQAFVGGDTMIHCGVEVALIPPVSGG